MDDFAGEELEDLKKRLKAAYEIYCKLKKEIEENSLDEETRSRELDFLRFEIQEIQEAALIPGEDRLLEEEYQKLSHGRKILEAVTEAHTLCGYEEAQAGEKIGHALKALAGVCSYDEKLGEFSIQLETIDSLLNDVARELWNYEQDFDYSEQRLHETEQRLNQINQLKMKYGADIEKILKAKEEKEARAEQLENYESYLQDKKAQYEKQQEQVEMFCCKISEIRRKKAGEFSQKVSTHLADLNFQDVRFQVALKQMDTYTDNGFDEPEYEIAFNVGESLKPLAKVASGGEMSRVMLALKTVLADQDEIQTVIFDEIDTGISGRTAQKVSEKMALIAKNRQVICITHLPQIASMADAHYFIEKSIEQTTTKTSIRKLEEEEMVMELARILGGVEITEKVIENAKDMKKQADQWKDHS